LGRISPKLVLTAVIVFIFAFGAILGLESFFVSLTHSASAEASNSSFMTETYQTAGWLPLLWAAVVLFAPVFEETFFRGFLFAGIERSRFGSVGTIILTSLVWASLHLQYNFIGMATIVILGLVLGTVRLKTHSLWPSILIHVFWNATALVVTAVSLRA
jgi:membrane protease YdiL (CAAX protease family)